MKLKMKLSLLDKSIPFSQLSTIVLDYVSFLVPATYSKVTTHQDLQFILAVTSKHWIRLIESKDGWSLHSMKERPDEFHQ